MGEYRRLAVTRVRALVLFMLMLFAVSAVPVFADPSPGESLTQLSAEEEEKLPDGADVAQGLQEAEEAEEAAQRRLETPTAEVEREESRTAYAGINTAEAEGLLERQFSEQLEAIDHDPARALTRAKLEQVLSPTGARVEVEGKTMLLEGTVPVRTWDEEGELSKVSLTLKHEEGEYVPANPITPVALPEQASEGISVGEDGLTVTPETAAGEGEARRMAGENLFYPEVEEDTDLLAAPVSEGVELFSQLRSADSPEELRFEVQLPSGAQLLPDGEGGAKVTEDGEPLARVPAPRATDAQGVDVPVSMAVEGDTLAVKVAHRGMDVAYPILVDPSLFDDAYYHTWYAGYNLPELNTCPSGGGAWAGNTNNSSRFLISTSTINTGFGGSGRGLFVTAKSTTGSQPANQFAQLAYCTPGTTTFINTASFSPLWRHDNGCGSKTYPEPHDYAGLWNNSTGWVSFYSNPAIISESAWMPGSKSAQTVIMGLGTGNGAGPISCWRDLYAGGAGIWLEDPESPTLTSVSGIPSGWLKKDETPRTIEVAASDPGLGVQEVRLLSPGEKEWHWNHWNGAAWCTGLSTSRCPASASGQITFNTAAFGEGEVPISVQALDPTGQGANSQSYKLLVDGTTPTINLSGQLANITAEAGAEENKNQSQGSDTLSLPTYNLTVEAKDGDATHLRSGVKEIKLFLDGGKAPLATQSAASCPAGNCPLTMNYTLKLPGLTQGKHTLNIVASDFAGNESKPEQRKIEFEYIPATGMKEEYVLQHIPLPDGHDHSGESEPHGPEIAVNVMNGNLVYHERDADVEGRAGNLELERFYNSQLPTEKDTQWGHGWTLAQTPELKPQQTEPKATMLRASGSIATGVALPQAQGQQVFDQGLHSKVAKTASGGYEVASETEQETAVFSATGRIEEARFNGQLPSAEKAPASPPTYESVFGSTGAGNGQFSHPAGIAVDSKGNVLVADQSNKRVEKFSRAGEYLSAFGSAGTGNGQFGRPTDIAIAANGNLWVTDAGNNRLEEFNEAGEYIAKVGSGGTGNLQFSGPEALAIDSKGNIWVADTYNHRVQELNEKGEFVRVFGAKGSEQGQLLEPTGIAVYAGNVWLVDWGNQRVVEFTETGTFVRQFGTEGTANGQFRRPDVIDIDTKGNVWVSDTNNQRVQEFNQSGEYVTQFGSGGSGQGQFHLGWSMGIAADPGGRIWVSDANNNRVEEFTQPNWLLATGAEPVVKYTYTGSALTKMLLEEPGPPEDPALAVNVSGGLVGSVQGEKAGTTSYSYEAGKLTIKSGSEGQAKFTYDASNRLKSVELPNGTLATIVYDSTSRVTEVTVKATGQETKTTHFWYGAEPRETRVWGGGNPEVVYSIGEDGSVFKWAYAETPPIFEPTSWGGSLWSNRNSTTPIENKDHLLFVTASSVHEIASIQVLVNGQAVVAEKTCEDKSQPPDHHCEHVKLEWITNPSEHAPGQLNLEVVATDFFGHAVAERFFVTIPQQPPPDPEAPPKPSFEQIKQFREEFGLDREHNYTEEQLTSLILELLYEWELQRPIAILAVERWGVPMRSPEVEEMEYRESYIEQFAEIIPEWAEAHAPSTYGGYYVDNRAGGIIYVGFTASQQSQVEALKQGAGLVAPGQVHEYQTPPTAAITTIEATEESVAEYIAANQTISQETTRIGAEPGSVTIKVGTSNPSEVQAYLEGHFGSGAPIETYLDHEFGQPEFSRYTTNGPINPGNAIMSNKTPCGNERVCWGDCTAGFGTRAFVGNQQGQPTYVWFTLTAGHCFSYEEKVNRSTDAEDNPKPLGAVRRYAWGSAGQKGVTDAEAIRIDPDVVSDNVFVGNPKVLLPMRGVMRARIGTTLCRSGRNGGVKCGITRRLFWTEYDGRWTREVEMTGGGATGDSGGPIWNPRTEKAVGLVSEGWATPQLPCHELASGSRYCLLHGITPLVPYGNRPNPAGALNVMGLEFVRGDF